MYVFDLDGTIALNAHRQHFVTRPKGERDWAGFNKACIDDTPCAALVQLMHALKKGGYTIAILSGRGMEVYNETIYWLHKHDVPFDYLSMRNIGDHRDDSIVKLEMMRVLENTYASKKVHAVFDDRKRVVDMWRENEYSCFQVAPGDF